MVQTQEVVPERRVRRWRSVSEKRQIVRLTMEPGASVAEIARAHGVNANQVFKWRRLFERGQLFDGPSRATALLPVTISGVFSVRLRGLVTWFTSSPASPHRTPMWK